MSDQPVHDMKEYAMHAPRTTGPALLTAALLALGACTTQPTAATTSAPTPTTTSTPSPTATSTPTPTPTQESIGPDGTVIAKDGKLWFACKNGIYTVDIPEGFSPEEELIDGKKNTTARSASNSIIRFHLTPRFDMPELPTREEMRQHLFYSSTLPWELLDDITEFAGRPAITARYEILNPSPESDPDFDGTMFTVYTSVGNTVWVFSFIGTTREEAEALLHQTAKTLKAVQEW